MKRIVFSLFICFLLFPSFVNAYECSASDRERLQKFANNVTFTLEEVNYNGNVYFDVLFAGVSNEIKIYDTENYVSYLNFSSDYVSEVEPVRLHLGQTYLFEVVPKNTCYFDVLRTITINTPVYNIYYNDPICDNAREYSLCQKWHNNSNITYEKFVLNVNNYIESNKEEVVIEDIQTGSSDAYLIFYSYYQKYYWYVLVGTVLILALLIYLWIKQNKKNKL